MNNTGLNKSDLIERLVSHSNEYTESGVEESVRVIIEQMTQTLASGKRIEIRGFGSFALNHRAPRIGRNPKTGETVKVDAKYVPHFKAGKSLRDEVDNVQ